MNGDFESIVYGFIMHHSAWILNGVIQKNLQRHVETLFRCLLLHWNQSKLGSYQFPLGNSNSITSFQRDQTPAKPSKNIDDTTHSSFNQFNLDSTKTSNTDGENVQHFGGSSNPYVNTDEKANLLSKQSSLSTSGETYTKDTKPSFFIKGNMFLLIFFSQLTAVEICWF